MNYDFAKKRHWRRSLWNCIVDRLSVPRREALCLYLAGESDEDRPVATSKGLSPWNMVAMERDPTALKALRDAGVLALEGDALKHIQAWRPGRKVDVLVLDLCGGLSVKLIDALFELATHPAFQGAVIAVNLLRGRDASSNEDRRVAGDWISQMLGAGQNSVAFQTGLVDEAELRQCNAAFFGANGTKHRGELLKMQLLRSVAFWLIQGMARELQVSAEEFASGKFTHVDEELSRRLEKLFFCPRWQTLSYRSTAHQTFDTLVYVNDFASYLGGRLSESLADGLNAAHGQSRLRRQQDAVMAHRTRRMA